jgi:hypothetical protein
LGKGKNVDFMQKKTINFNDIHEATQNVLEEAKDNNITNAICFGLSNTAIQKFADSIHVKSIEFDIPFTTKVKMSIWFQSSPPISVSINANDQTIKITFPVSVVFRDEQGSYLASVSPISIDTTNSLELVNPEKILLLVKGAIITNRTAIRTEYSTLGRQIIPIEFDGVSHHKQMTDEQKIRYLSSIIEGLSNAAAEAETVLVEGKSSTEAKPE